MSLKSQNSLHEGTVDWEVFVARFVNKKEPKITWGGGQELTWRSDFPRIRTGKRPLLFFFMDWKRLLSLTSSSCGLRLLNSPWRCSPSPRHSAGPGAVYRREVIQEKTNLMIRFFRLSRLTHRQGSWFNTSCSEV